MRLFVGRAEAFARIRAALQREFDGQVAMADEAKTRGPLWALHRASRRELQAGVLWRFVLAPSWISLFSSPVGLRIAAFLLPIVLVVGTLAVTSEALKQALAWQVGVTFVVLLYASLASWALFMVALKKTRSAFTAQFSRWSPEDLVFFGSLTIATPALGFAVLSSVLVRNGVLAETGVSLVEPTLPFRTFEVFLWAFADAIPILKIPDTLGWKPQLVFTTTLGGALVLAYKIIEILPIAQLLSSLLKELFGEPDEREA
jgi:hypothetical protein